jgi:MFS family permease
MHGLYVLWWVRERHVPVAVVAAILAAGDLAVSAFELPTGWVADRYGHRVSLIAGSLLQIAGMLFAWFGTGVPGVLFSVLSIAAGDAFRSGADQALLYRSCIALGDAGFQRREARARALQLASLVGLVLAGGAIVNRWGFGAGWFVETLLCGAGLAIASAMAEPPPAGDPLDNDRLAYVGAAATVSGWRRARELSALAVRILPAAILIAVASAGLFIVQSASESDAVAMTTAVAVATLAEAGGAFAGARVTGGLWLQIALAALGAAALGTGIVVPQLFHAAVAAACFLMGVVEPIRAASIQRVAADGVRARAASLASACDKLLLMAALLAAGVLRTSSGFGIGD